VKALRLARGWTLAETGEQVGRLLGKSWSPQAVWQAENGQRDYAAAHVTAFAVAFEVPVSDLFEKLPFITRNPHAEQVARLLNVETDELIAAIRSLPGGQLKV
jgi:transcriptional regulator with XRE-family HTH domain